jgi:hypothetical protein
MSFEKTVCKYCGEIGYGGVTIGCSDCWEIGHRLRDKSFRTIEKIFAANRPDLEVTPKKD